MWFLPSGLRAVISLLESRTVNGGQWEEADFKASLPPQLPPPHSRDSCFRWGFQDGSAGLCQLA